MHGWAERKNTMSFSGKIQTAFFLSLFLLASNENTLASERRLSGREIFRQQCAKCHGRSGEGVKGKYDDALAGDWPIEKLTRYIDKKMPDDAPEKCIGPNAEAVARYIYGAFYSREARARNHPARIELVRLTNRQFLNSVADLIQHFTGSNSVLSAERGLKAAYYNSRNVRRGDKLFDRVDRQVNFDFGTNGPNAKPSSTNGFSVQWRGSLIADETGDFEIILKTPNGARLWINDDEQPLIDAWVASGDLNEHKAKARLIGGRAYPLKLDHFKFKDKTASIFLEWKPPHGVQVPIAARNLSPESAPASFVFNTPFPPDDSSVGYERGVSVSQAWDEAATHAAIEVANYVFKNLDKLSGSKPEDSNRLAKFEAFGCEFVETAFRRPLTDDQKRLFVSAQFKSAAKPEAAIKRVVMLALKSPRFLYLGLESAKPDDFAVAQRLSFALWDSIPDGPLLQAAKSGKLHTPEQVNTQAWRMLGDSRARAKMQYFLQQWLQINQRDDLTKDEKLYPGFTPEIISDLRTSLNLFLTDAVWKGSSDFRTLLLADYLFLNDRLAKFYGLKTNSTDDFVKVTLDPKERSGVVSHPYLLAEFSYQKSTSPIHRGVFLTRNIVGRALKPPPMAMTFKDADFAPTLTMREKVSELTRPQACQSCHSVINPLGFSLEQYDAVGRFRTQENDRPVDAVSNYTTDEGETIRLSGARDLARFAAGSEQAQNAFIEQMFDHIVKQPMEAYGSGVASHLRRFFVTSEFNMQKLLVEIAKIAALHDMDKSVKRAPGKKSR